VWDYLPSQITGTAPLDCPTVISAILDGGSCANGTQIQWTNGVTVPAGTLSGGVVTPGTTTLTYVMTVPTSVAPGETLGNHAGVVSYQGTLPNSSSDPSTFYPPNNIDPAAPADPETTTRADDTASVVVTGVSVAKTRTTSVNEAGNNAASQATIGESITYTVTATIPAGVTVRNGVLSDPLGTVDTGQQNLEVGTTTGTLDGGALPGDFSVSETNNTPTITLGASYGPTDSAHVLVMTFTAVVNNVAANARNASISNVGHFSYKDSAGVAQQANSPSVATTVVEPNLRLSKTDSPGGPYTSGATVNYTVTVTNPTVIGATAYTNVSSAHDLVVTDVLDVGMTPVTPVPNGGVATYDAGTSKWTLTWTVDPATSLAPDASLAFAYQATLPVNPVGMSVFTNNATVHGTSLDVTAYPGARTDGTGYVATAQDPVVVGGVSVTKSVTPGTGTIGEDRTFTVTATIPPDLTFPQLTVLDTLPDGMTFDGYASGTCVEADSSACGSDVVISGIGSPVAGPTGTTPIGWSLGNILPDIQSRTVTLTYNAYPSKTYHSGSKVIHGQSLVNTVGAYWAQSPGSPPDSVPPASNYPFGSPTATASLGVVEPQLSLAKSASTSAPTPGVPFTYTLTLKNKATSSAGSCAYGVSVTDPLPAGVSGATNLVASQGSASFNAGTSTVTWDPTVADTLCPAGNGVAPGVTATLTFTTVLAASGGLTTGGSVVNTGSTSTYFGVDPSVAGGDAGRYVTYPVVTGSVTVHPLFPHLAATKIVTNGSDALIGTPFSWSYTLTNPSPAAPAYGVGAVDVLPAHWVYVAGSTVVTPSGGGGSSGSAADPTVTTNGAVQTLTWSGTQLGDLGVGANISVTYQATPQTGASLGAANPNVNTVQSSANDGSGASGNASGAYLSNVANANAVIAAADLSISKTVGLPGTFIAGGSNNTFVLGVHNAGPSAAANPVVSDTVPSGATWTFASADGSGWDCATWSTVVTCTANGPLAAGADAAPITVGILVPSNYGPGTVDNTASVSSSTYDPDPSNNTANASAPVEVQADLSIAKSTVGPFTAGGDGTYQVTVTNLGPSDSPAVSGSATPITVTDSLPTGMTYVGLAPGSDWTCRSAGGQLVVCTLGAGLVLGAHSSFTLDVALDSSIANGTVLVNHADIAATTVTDPNPGNNHTAVPVVVGTSADLSIAKTYDSGDSFTPGTLVHYHLAVANAGVSDALAPHVVDNLDPAAFDTVVSAGGTGWTCTITGLAVVCDATGPLAAGASAHDLVIVAHLSSSETLDSVSNTATVSSTTYDPNPDNNHSTVSSSSGPTSADLGVTKTHDPTVPFVAGGNGTYTLGVVNNGPSDALAPVVVDTLPVGMTYVSSVVPSGWSVVAGTVAPGVAQTVTFTDANPLADQASASFTLVVAVASDVLPVSLINSATVSSSTPDPVPSNNTAHDPTEITTSADLSIVKTHGEGDTFTPGTQVTYALAVHNAGLSDAEAPVVVDNLPNGLTYVAATGTGWNCAFAAPTVTCTATGPLAAGSDSSIALVVTVQSSWLGGAISNTASVSSPTTDPNPDNNHSTDVSPVPVPSADLSIVKTHLGTQVTAGTNATYTLAVANAGPSDAAAPVVSDTLPGALTYVSATGSGWVCGDVGQVVTCTADQSLAAGASAGLISVVVAVSPSATSTLANTATVSSTTADPNTENNSSTDTVTLATSADLSITKTHTGPLVIGAQTTYTISVHNAGPSDAVAPVVTDTLPASLTYVSAIGTGWTCAAVGQVVTCTAGNSLAAGADAAPIALAVTVGAGAYPKVTNAATVSSTTSDPNPTNNTASDPGTVSPQADLAIAKTVQSSGMVIAGGSVAWNLAVTNLGPTEDPGPVSVTDNLPAALTYVSASGTGWTCANAGQAVTCTLPGAFAVGQNSAISLVTTPGAGAVPSVTNTASVAGTGNDPNPANNTSSASTPVSAGALLSITKTLVGGTLTAGSHATYTISVHNAGPSPAEGVVVTDDLPSGLTYVSGTGDGWTCTNAGQVVTCSLAGSLAVGADASISLVVLVSAAAGGSIANTATVSSTTSLDGNSTTTASTPAVVVAAGGGGGGGGGHLAWTGFDPSGLLGIGLGLLAAGLLLMRRRSRRPATGGR
jgi:uncharacterized repeat protein (TIGR01451 family)/fimbrial isopeptide formation D2 family protein